VLEWLTALPMRVLKDKEGNASNKRLLRSLDYLLKAKEHDFSVCRFGLSKSSKEVVTV
jgi:hypothetical protein